MQIKNFLKNRNNRLMLVILIIGIGIIAVSGILPSGTKQTEGSATSAEFQREEERLSEILSKIEGAGEISVMISYESTAEKELAGEQSGRTFSYSGDVVVKREVYPKVRGVIIVADGADDPRVRQQLSEAAAAVTGAGMNRVCVYHRTRK